MLFLRLLPMGQGYVPLKLSDDNKRRYYCQGESQSDYCNSPSVVKTCKIIRIICFCRTEYIYIVKSRRSIYTVILLPVIFIYADFVFGYFLRIARRAKKYGAPPTIPQATPASMGPSASISATFSSRCRRRPDSCGSNPSREPVAFQP